MKVRTTKSFWKHYWALPPEIRQRAQQAYTLWRDNPSHPSLFFKRVKESQPLYSVRIGLGYRALGLLKEGTVTWFWIGGHDKYDRLIK
jgi:mRNA-degrading endonuclease RelE of RelBE toxin-antitoxin system